MPRSLDLGRLRQFEPSPSQPEPSRVAADGKERLSSSDVPAPGRWPSREPVRDGQISIKAPLEVIERFRRLCHDDRRTYADMLAILMTSYDQKG